ncbi:MAG: hypothetical protein PVF90_09535 [Gemmatimonadota bacterium]|jgi:hypothetical protein
MRKAALAVVVSVLSIPVGIEAQAPVPELEGAWLITEMAAGDQTLTSPQPGLLLFTGRYYSYTLVTGSEPRRPIPPGVASAPDLLRAWNPFSANAGTYEISGDSMIRYPIVAKNPATMAPGTYNEYTFRLSADTLWVTTVGTETGPARNPTTVKYVRQQ